LLVDFVTSRLNIKTAIAFTDRNKTVNQYKQLTEVKTSKYFVLIGLAYSFHIIAKPMTTPEDCIRQPRLLCLHGFRTSGEILGFQMGGLKYTAKLSCDFINAPFRATGSPSEDILQYFPGKDYYEWHPDMEADIATSTDYVLKLWREGNYDGLLGFSQGAAMCTRVAKCIEEDPSLSIKAVVLFGGSNPFEWPMGGQDGSVLLKTPSLHIQGLADYVRERSKLLEEFYDASSRTVLTHEEGHKIPSKRTDLYPSIKEWIYEHTVNV